jgi:CRP/FNR family cyclic AMP-dependent transcriptional regulator
LPRVSRDSKLLALKTVPLFAGLSKRDLASVGSIADELEVRAGKELIREQEPGRQFFILLEGEVEVRRRGRKVAVLGPGDFFGEVALVSDRLTSATVTTLGSARIVVITRTAFGRLLRDAPQLQLRVLEAVAKRLPDE